MPEKRLREAYLGDRNWRVLYTCDPKSTNFNYVDHLRNLEYSETPTPPDERIQDC